MAACEDHVAVVKLLCDKGADLNIVDNVGIVYPYNLIIYHVSDRFDFC